MKTYMNGERVTIKAEWRDGDENGAGYIVVEDRGDRLAVTHEEFAGWTITPVEVIGKEMVEVNGK